MPSDDDFRELFSRRPRHGGKRSRLKRSTIRHDRLDEGVLDGIRQDARHFDQAFTPPDVDNGDATKTIEPYEPWGDLVADVFFIYHTYDEPQLEPEDQIKESRKLHRRILDQLLNSDDVREARKTTRLDEVAAAIAVIAVLNGLRELLEGELAAEAERAQHLHGAEQRFEQASEANDNLREEVAAQDGEMSDEQRTQMKANAKARAEAKRDIERLSQKPPQLSPAAAQAVREAARQAKVQTAAIGQLPGTGTGRMAKLPADKMFELAKRVRESQNAREVLRRFGRIERDMRYQRTNRIVGGREEIVDVETGADLTRALPSELLKLGHPLLKLDFMRRFHENSLLQYEMVGEQEVGFGPIVVALDSSGSMDGEKNWWARGTVLGLLALAHRERRSFCVIEFDVQVKQEYTFDGRKPISPEDVVAFAEKGARGGGTRIHSGFSRAMEIVLEAPPFKSADIVIVTDGGDSIRPEDEALAETAREQGVGLHGISVMQAHNKWLDAICDDHVQVEDLANPSDATRHIAEVLT